MNEELLGGARINYIFNDIFKRAIITLDPFEFVNDNVKYIEFFKSLYFFKRR